MLYTLACIALSLLIISWTIGMVVMLTGIYFLVKL